MLEHGFQETTIWTTVISWSTADIIAVMENASLLTDVPDNVTTSTPRDDAQNQYAGNIRNLALQIIYFIVGTVGVVDNLFVIIVFALFVKIRNKVCIDNPG